MDNACYTKVIDLLRDNILATDLAIHLKILPKMSRMVTVRVLIINYRVSLIYAVLGWI